MSWCRLWMVPKRRKTISQCLYGAKWSQNSMSKHSKKWDEISSYFIHWIFQEIISSIPCQCSIFIYLCPMYFINIYLVKIIWSAPSERIWIHCSADAERRKNVWLHYVVKLSEWLTQKRKINWPNKYDMHCIAYL